DDAALQPVRAAFRMRGDDDLVGAERPQGVLHRLKRVAVADLAARVDPELRETGQAQVEPLLGARPRAVLVRQPVPERRVERRADDQDPGPVAGRRAPDRLAQALARDRLVRDDEDPALVLGTATGGRPLLRPRSPLAEK